MLTLAKIKHAHTLRVPQSVSQSACVIIILILFEISNLSKRHYNECLVFFSFSGEFSFCAYRGDFKKPTFEKTRSHKYFLVYFTF